MSSFLKELDPGNIDNFVLGTKNATESIAVDVVEGEFWTSAQRQAANLHEISYRACFKPQLPHFFISRFTNPGDVVYDPFSGRGTTAIEAALNGRQVIVNDINPLTTHFTRPRLDLPEIEDIAERLSLIPKTTNEISSLDLSMFYENDTLNEIVALRTYLIQREQVGKSDALDRWIRMAATNRLTGHSPGFFSVYSMPPNQAVSPQSQIRINEKRNQVPSYRDTHALILKKSKQLQKNLNATQAANLRRAAETAIFLSEDAAETSQIPANSVQLTVTSPPFLDVVQYSDDNWLRGWFNNIDMDAVGSKITMSKTLDDWNLKMGSVFEELYRITKPGGYVAFEVGEVRNGKIKLEDAVVPLGITTGFRCQGVILNTQEFTKTSNIWGIDNNSRGTNTNRIVVFRK
jgi:hypothetical protein